MTSPDLISLFVQPLERLDLAYMITGGVASVIYGDPRFTRDVEIVLRLARTGTRLLHTAYDAEAFYVPPEDALLQEVERPEGGHFNIIHRETALRADIYLASGSGHDPRT